MRRFPVVFRAVLGALGLVCWLPVASFAQAPTVTHRNPSQLDVAGGQTIRLTGTGFTPGTTVRLGVDGPFGLDVRADGPTSLTFVAPPHPAGDVALEVANGSDSVTLSPGLRYREAWTSRLTGGERLAIDYSGRWVAFETRRSLIPADTNGVADIYVLDKAGGALIRVSVSAGGGQAIGGESFDPAISASGRFVAFASRATNLIPGDTNGLVDVFVHDRDADGDGAFDEALSTRTERVSVPHGVNVPTSGVSRHPSISGDGRYVAFETTAVLVDGPHVPGRIDIRIHDRLSGLTSRVAFAGLFDGDITHPVISQNGRIIVFQTAANWSSDAAGYSDVFRHDRDADGDGVMDNATLMESISRATPFAAGNGHSTDPSVSADGRYVVYASAATNLDTARPDTNGERDIFLWDDVARTTRRLSVTAAGEEFAGPSERPSLSANGRRLVFVTSGVNLPSSGGVVAALDDGRRVLASLASPTISTPRVTGPMLRPLSARSDAGDPVVSGDGTDIGWTEVPRPGLGEPDSSGIVLGVIDEFADEPTPFISGLQPASGLTAGGGLVEIAGGNFRLHATSVQWGNTILTQPGQVTFVTPELLRLAAPPGAAGGVPVRVRTYGIDTEPAAYTYTNLVTPPTITGFTPSTALVSNDSAVFVTISGTGFSSPRVRFGDVTVVPTSWTPTSITVQMPDTTTAGPVPLVVTNVFQRGATTRAAAPFVYTDRQDTSTGILQVLPDSGPTIGGTTVTIFGRGFKLLSTVTVGGVPATAVHYLSSVALLATIPPGDGPGLRPLWVVSPFNVQPQALSFFTYTPQPSATTACDGMDADGDQLGDAWEAQYGLSPADPADAGLDWDRDGRTNLQECQAGTHPRGLYTRYLAEGATGSFFETRVVIANPATTPAHVLARFVTGTGATVPYAVTIPATTRLTLDLATVPGLTSANVSTVVESDVEVVVDRTMRWDAMSRAGAHAETSVAAPAVTWYLAEGATHGSFDLFYLIANTHPTIGADVQIRFLRPAPAAPIVRTYYVAPNSRFTLPVDGVPGLEASDVSAVVTATNGIPVIVERAMYSSAAGVFAAGHDAAGVTAPALRWFFAEGATGAFFDTFLLLANPNDVDAAVTIRYLLAGGGVVERARTVPANSRQTIWVGGEDALLANTALSAVVSSTNGVPIIAERSMWWPHGSTWTEAHASAGSTTTGTRWAVGDGEVGPAPDDAATFLLVANTDSIQITVRVTLLLEFGPPIVKDFFVPANSRFNVPIVSTEVPDGAGHIRVPRGTRFSAIVESVGVSPSPIVVERAMYWNANGQLWAAGSGLLATKLQ